MFRVSAALQSQARRAPLEAVVVGGGPAGLAVVGNLLQDLPETSRQQLWVDPSFSAGRVAAKYREVPSNTKVDLFLEFAKAIEPFRQIVAAAPTPNAITALQSLPQERGCELGKAADMCLMLTEGLQRHFPEAKQQHGKVTKAVLDKSTRVWTVSLDNHEPVTSKRLVLCSGSRPIDTTPPNLQNNTGSQLAYLDLDTALKPTLLAKTLDPNTPATIGVVGASHSAILVLLNLYNLAATSHPYLRIKWFSRHKELRYAKPMDGWILYDNTGLKGDAAQWARDNLEEATFHASPASQVITKLFTGTGPGEQQVYQDELPQCTHLVQAIGYQRDPLPLLSAVERAESEPLPLPVNHDGISGRFFANPDHQDSGRTAFIPGLFGAGIAFPERVTDPAGNVEHAVGFWKFMRFLRRVVPQWIEKP